MKSRALVVLWALATVVSPVFGQEVRYFATVDDSIGGGLIGLDPVAKTDLEKRKGYRFDYDGTAVAKVTFVDPFHQYGAASSFFGCASVEYHPKDKNALEVVYRDEDGQVTRNDSGVFIEADLLDDRGRPVKTTNLNAEHHPMLDSYGVCVYTYEYQGNLRISRRFDSQGTQISDTSKVFVRNIVFNAQSLLETSISYDAAGKPVASDDGVVGERDFYDDRSNLIREDYFSDDGTGHFVDATDSAGIHSTQYTVDSFGNTLSVRTYSLTGEKKADQDGVFETVTQYDPDGYVVLDKTLGVDGRPCEVKGVSEIRYRYDDKKNNFNEKRMARDGTVSVEYRRKFDQNNRIIAGATFDDQGQPLDQKADDGDYSYCLVLFSYRDDGQVEARYFNSEGLEVGPDPGPSDDSTSRI